MGRCEVKEDQMLDLIKAAWEECYPGQTWLDANSVVTPAHVPQLNVQLQFTRCYTVGYLKGFVDGGESVMASLVEIDVKETEH